MAAEARCVHTTQLLQRNQIPDKLRKHNVLFLLDVSQINRHKKKREEIDCVWVESFKMGLLSANRKVNKF